MPGVKRYPQGGKGTGGNGAGAGKGGGKGKAHSLDVKGSSSKGERGGRSKNTVKRLKMLNSGNPIRNKNGEVKYHELQSTDKSHHARVMPDRRWFGNTRVIGQGELATFREDLGARVRDPYSVVLKGKSLPLALLNQSGGKAGRPKLLQVESFSSTFGKRSTRKQPRLPGGASDFGGLVAGAERGQEAYGEGKRDRQQVTEGHYKDAREEVRGSVFFKGTSSRIWGELHKVLDSSDVVIHVLDSRDPMGTRCRAVENHLRKECPHKHLIFLLNKCDLVPTWVTARWLKVLSQFAPTLAFHASLTNSFGKGALISLLRQLGKLHSDKKHVSVGFIGYPNVGKSSVINCLRGKTVARAAPVPGHTKVWQYVTLTQRIYLIDCPGVVYGAGTESEVDCVLKGIVRVERLDDAAAFIPDVLERVKHEYVAKAYGIAAWATAQDFLTQLAVKTGKLLPGREPDYNAVAKMVLQDWQRGRIPYFAMPPDLAAGEAAAIEGPGGEKLTEEELAKLQVRRQPSRKIQVAPGLYNDEDLNGPEGEPDDSADDEVMLDAGAGSGSEWEDDEEEENMGEEGTERDGVEGEVHNEEGEEEEDDDVDDEEEPTWDELIAAQAKEDAAEKADAKEEVKLPLRPEEPMARAAARASAKGDVFVPSSKPGLAQADAFKFGDKRKARKLAVRAPDAAGVYGSDDDEDGSGEYGNEGEDDDEEGVRQSKRGRRGSVDMTGRDGSASGVSRKRGRNDDGLDAFLEENKGGKRGKRGKDVKGPPGGHPGKPGQSVKQKKGTRAPLLPGQVGKMLRSSWDDK